MDTYLAPGRRSTSVWMLAVAAFMLISVEANLVKRILLGAGTSIYPWNYGIPIIAVFPLLIGLRHIRRMKKLETSGDVSSGAVARISSDVTSVVVISYCLVLIFSISW
jgi:hypothetical protein